MPRIEVDLELPKAELEVLKVLWEESPCTVRDVLGHLHRRGRRVAYTTVLTFLSRLEQKGFVKADKSGVAFVYSPTIAREKVRRSRVRSIVQQLYDGSACPLVLQLMESESFTRDEIAQLSQLIDKLDQENNTRAAARPRAKRSKAKPR